MRSFLDQGFVVQDSCGFLVLPGLVTLTGRVQCLGNIELCVLKEIDILSGTGPEAMVERRKYSYHAQFINGPYILRYDSPVDHRPFHHKHVYDPLGTRLEIDVIRIADMDETPTMGDVINELQEWYWANEPRISALGLG